jgi:hypothetical protein
MSSDNIQRKIEFILEHQAKFSEDIDWLKEVQKQQGENIDKLTSIVGSVIEEMRDSFNQLIVANEVTRNLAEEVTKLAIQTSQRVTRLEEKVS